jgi:TolB-like protein
MGTPSYMSPEQTRGQPLDKRADIWAFGCVVYEALTGKRAFSGQTLPAVFLNICEKDPEWNALPTNTPESVRKILQRCLCKELNRRLRDIGEARILLEELTRDFARTQEIAETERLKSHLAPTITAGGPLAATTPAGATPADGAAIQVGARDYAQAGPGADPTAAPYKAPARPVQVAQAPRPAAPSRGGGLILLVALIFLLTAGGAVYYLVFIQGKTTHSVAVLDFDAPGADVGLQTMATRLTTDVTNQMTKIRHLKVAQPDEVKKVPPGTSPQEAGRQLGVRAVLKGTLSQVGGVYNLKLQLIDVDSGQMIWSTDGFDADKASIVANEWPAVIAKGVQDKLK